MTAAATPTHTICQTIPEFMWHWSDDPIYLASFRKFHCKLMDAQSASDFLTAVASALRPDPVLGPIQPTFDAKQLEQMAAAGLVSEQETAAERAHLARVKTEAAAALTAATRILPRHYDDYSDSLTTLMCERCRKTGHHINECWVQHPHLRPTRNNTYYNSANRRAGGGNTKRRRQPSPTSNTSRPSL